MIFSSLAVAAAATGESSTARWSGPMDPHGDPDRMPRRSNPLSFLSKRVFAFATLLFLSATSTSVAEANAMTAVEMVMEERDSNDCVCDYDPSIDYFPHKFTVEHSSSFTIEYFNSYKRITVTDSGVQYVTLAYLCGTPIPREATTNNTSLIQLPIKTSVVTSILFVSYLEYLGLRDTVFSVGSVSPGSFKPCLRKLYDEGRISDGFVGIDYEKVRTSVAQAHGPAQELDVVFMDNYNYKFAKLPARVSENFGPHTQSIYLAEQLEVTSMGKLEWLKFVAAFYNREAQANALLSGVHAKYACLKRFVANETGIEVAAASPPIKKRVLWGYCYKNLRAVGGAQVDCYVAMCPNYYCDLVHDAGAELLVSDKQKLNLDEMYALAELADVWIFTNANWNSTGEYNLPFYVGEVRERFSQLEVVRRGQVFDILGTSWNDWFEDIKTEPVVVLMDLIQTLNTSRAIELSTRKPKFFRNVLTEPEAFQDERLASDCVNETAPIYAESFTGFCSLAIPARESAPLCTPNAQSGGERGDGGEHIPFAGISFGVALLFVLGFISSTALCAASLGKWESRRERERELREAARLSEAWLQGGDGDEV